MKDLTIYQYEFSRTSIESKDVNSHFRILNTWVKDKAHFQNMLHRVMFSVSGYDLDVRGLAQIPEVSEFFRELNKRWPYFMNFAFPHPVNYDWWFLICYTELVNIVDGEAIRAHLTEKDLMRFYTDWFSSANLMASRHQIPSDLYEFRQIEMINSFTSFIVNDWPIRAAKL